jgi:hypothetical protein
MCFVSGAVCRPQCIDSLCFCEDRGTCCQRGVRHVRQDALGRCVRAMDLRTADTRATHYHFSLTTRATVKPIYDPKPQLPADKYFWGQWPQEIWTRRAIPVRSYHA